jgi:hypothetical protein
MTAKKDKFTPLPNGTWLKGWRSEVYRYSRSTGMPCEYADRRVRDQVYGYHRGQYILGECRIKPDEIGPGKRWEVDPDQES